MIISDLWYMYNMKIWWFDFLLKFHVHKGCISIAVSVRYVQIAIIKIQQDSHRVNPVQQARYLEVIEQDAQVKTQCS
jgi:hypothetical protein